jgi:hypothetical protein
MSLEITTATMAAIMTLGVIIIVVASVLVAEIKVRQI